jgi:serine acetyltransferase
MAAERQETRQAVLRRVTEEIVRRAVRLGRKHGRTVYISRTSRGRGVPVDELDPGTAEGRAELDRFFARPARHFTISGLGAPEEPGSINWRVLNAPFWRRALSVLAVSISLFLKGNPAKNRFLRWMGVHVGQNVEVMQMVWLDHFRPELIFIGDGTLLGAFTRITVHTYEGAGRFRYGLIEIGERCTIGAGVGIGVIEIEEGVRILPGTVVSPYFPRIEAGSVVGYDPPPLAAAGERLPMPRRRPASRSGSTDAAAGGAAEGLDAAGGPSIVDTQ